MKALKGSKGILSFDAGVLRETSLIQLATPTQSRKIIPNLTMPMINAKSAHVFGWVGVGLRQAEGLERKVKREANIDHTSNLTTDG